MSIIKSIMHQLGLSGDPAKNFTLSVPAAPDGTMKLARGNAGATTQDIMTVAADGKVAFPQGVVPRAWSTIPLPTVNTDYTNNTKSDLVVSYTAQAGGASVGLTIRHNALAIAYTNIPTNGFGGIQGTIPSGGVWRVEQAGGTATFLGACQLAGD